MVLTFKDVENEIYISRDKAGYNINIAHIVLLQIIYFIALYIHFEDYKIIKTSINSGYL